MINAQAPSDSTKPSRCASNGREATSGSGFLVSAVIWEKAATVSGSVADSEPPAIQRSSVPSRSSRMASKIAWLLDEHAEIVAKFAPVRPNVIAMCPAGAFAMSIGTMNGETFPGPLVFSTSYAFRSVSIPPIPVAKITPPRSETTCGSPASAHASLAAAMPNCVKRSVRRASFRSRWSSGSKSTSPATVTGRSSIGNRVIVRTPFRPLVSPCQKSSTPVPTGVTGPSPVMTTLRRSSRATVLRNPQLRRDHVDGLPDRLHALHLVLGDLDAPLLLEREHRFHQVERVSVQVLREPGVGDDLRLVDGQLFRQDLLDPDLDLRTIHPFPPATP